MSYRTLDGSGLENALVKSSVENSDFQFPRIAQSS